MIEQSIVLTQIIFIDVIMAADNAIIIGMIAASFAPKHRNQIIIWGVVGALVFRIIFEKRNSKEISKRWSDR